MFIHILTPVYGCQWTRTHSPKNSLSVNRRCPAKGFITCELFATAGCETSYVSANTHSEMYIMKAKLRAVSHELAKATFQLLGTECTLRKP